MNKRFTIGKFPRTRLRRNRQSTWCRSLISETKLSTNDLILPLFITEGKKVIENINSFPSVKRYSVDTVLKKIEEVKNLNIPVIDLHEKLYKNHPDVKSIYPPDMHPNERGYKIIAETVFKEISKLETKNE